MTALPDVYDVVAYPTFAYQDTHPSRLATMAMLHGLHPVPVERCRVLEVGCNAATNLIPMAYGLPQSQFVGFDLAAAPIARGRETIKALGLTNIQIVQADVMESEGVPELAGEFDYIIAHGVYAWVPSAVRDRLLSFCREHLSRNGVAFISYAALPGGYLRMLGREMLRFREPAAERSEDSVRDAVEFLKFIAGCRPEGDGFRVLLEREIHGMERRGPAVVFHDEMSTFHQPVSFTQFTTHAAQHALRYFSEAELPGPKDPCFQAETAKAIQGLAGGDPLAQEQILDFARMRMYRESLLCHAEAVFTYDLQAGALRGLLMTSSARSAAEDAGSRTYTLPGGIQIATQHPATIVLLEHLIARSPEAVTFAEAAALLERQGLFVESELLVLILRLVISRMIDLHAWQAPIALEVQARPLASAVCREEAARGTKVTTLLHTVLDVVDPALRQLMLLLDGTRDHPALLRDLVSAVPAIPPEQLAEGIEPALEMLARAGVLERADE